MRTLSYAIILLGIAIFLHGCVAAPIRPDAIPPAERTGVYHKVNAGETLWRIAKTYDIDIDEIIRSNQIPNIAQIETNQLIFIPGAKEVRQVITLSDPESALEFMWPLRGKIVTYFGEYKDLSTAKGIDILAEEGDQVLAARSGRVVFADYLNGHAQTVILDHGDGLYTVYSQNDSLLVDLGDQVSKGTPIATVGRSRDMALVHFEIRNKRNPDNPLFYLP